MFDYTSEELARYCQSLRGRGEPTLNWELAQEALKRLGQMDRLLRTVAELDAESRQIVAAIGDYARHEQGEPPTPEMFHRTRAIGQDVELLTEAFYYFAFRCREVVRQLPGLKKFEAKGVRDVRNQLIEHPEKSQVLEGSFKHGGAEGPVVKALRRDGQEDIFVDRGLFVNAAELRDELERRLTRLATLAHGSGEQ